VPEDYPILIEKMQEMLAAHVAHYGPEGMTMPYVMHWAVVFSIADMGESNYISMRAFYPEQQPGYVTSGLLSEAAGVLIGVDMDDE
jgi:hypothetical protein